MTTNPLEAMGQEIETLRAKARELDAQYDELTKDLPPRPSYTLPEDHPERATYKLAWERHDQLWEESGAKAVAIACEENGDCISDLQAKIAETPATSLQGVAIKLRQALMWMQCWKSIDYEAQYRAGESHTRARGVHSTRPRRP